MKGNVVGIFHTSVGAFLGIVNILGMFAAAAALKSRTARQIIARYEEFHIGIVALIEGLLLLLSWVTVVLWVILDLKRRRRLEFLAAKILS